jgi:alkanesulfonate monooxygenase SsuD/methylene tetrahydromethanopterin reductase-like flavin-dependent oxidoreductase (luciferase family)
MQLGLFNLMTLRDHPDGALGVMRDTRKMVEIAEELDFDIAWFAEHHFANYSSSPSPLMMCSYAAGWTKKIKLGPGVIVLPLYNPLRVAQEIAVADTQSGGRLVIGLSSIAIAWSSTTKSTSFSNIGTSLSRPSSTER